MRPLRFTLRALRASLVLSIACAVLAHASWPSDPSVNLPVSVAAGEQFWPRSVSDGAGGIITAWVDQRVFPANLYAQRVTLSGVAAWTLDGVAVSTGGVYPTPPAIVSDGAGGAIIAWTTYPGGAADIFAQRVDASGAPLWGAGGVKVCAADGNQVNPVIASDSDGGAIVVWNDSRSGAAGYYAQRLTASGLVLWTPDGARVMSTLGPGSAVIAPDGGGGAFLAVLLSGVSTYSAFAQRVDASGVPQWGPGGFALWPSPFFQSHPAVAADGMGGAWFVWNEFSASPAAQIFGQRLDADGVRLWGPGVVTIAPNASASNTDSIAVLPRNGGAIVAWTDQQAGSLGIRAQRLDLNGARQWDASGVPVSSTASSQWGLGLADDGADGALLCWNDARNGAADIYAQALGASGVPRWNPAGLAVSTATGFQWMPAVVSDGMGGAVLAWQDYRASATDVYAQRVRAIGSLDVPLAPGAALSLAAPVPSPARAARGATLRFSLASAGVARLSVLDVAGRELRVLADGDIPAGAHEVHWDARDAGGGEVPPGLYLIRLRAAGRVASTKLVVAR